LKINKATEVALKGTKMKTAIFSISLMLCLAFSGCGTIVHGTRQKIDISTDPAGASVTVQPTGETARTPATIDLKRKHDYRLSIEKDGYQPVSVSVKHPNQIC
jgi:uncharacterized protein YceK